MSTQIDDDQNESRTETVVIYSQNIQLLDDGRGTDHRFAFVYLSLTLSNVDCVDEFDLTDSPLSRQLLPFGSEYF